jgi:transposase InsO family protein
MIRVDRKLNSTDVLDALTDLFILRGPPEYIRSDNGPEFIAQKVRDWIVAVGAKTILRKLQRPVPRRAAERRILLQPKGGANPNRAMAYPLQHRQAA